MHPRLQKRVRTSHAIRHHAVAEAAWWVVFSQDMDTHDAPANIVLSMLQETALGRAPEVRAGHFVSA